MTHQLIHAMLIWLCFIPIAILNGGLRTCLLDKWLGEKAALPVSGILLSSLIFAMTLLLFPRLGKVSQTTCKAVSCLWITFTVLFEFSFGISEGTSFKQLLQAYNPLTGNLWLLVLFTTALSPIIVRKIIASKQSKNKQTPMR